MDISASALTAQRFRMDVIAENIANANTTRMADGQPYRRRYTVFQTRGQSEPFSSYIDTARNAAYGNGVRVISVGTDPTPFKYDYNPSHPDADENGYVRMPNVDTVREMTDMITTQRVYDANQRMITIHDAILNRIANDIGRKS